MYAITKNDEPRPNHFDGTILVPYPIESLLSGVSRRLETNEILWYARNFSPNGLTTGSRLLLHFEAVDFYTTAYVNDTQVGTHLGGYQSFTFDITHAVRPGVNELVVEVLDPTETGINPHGKQTRHPGGIAYTGSSGIWQTVWLEVVPQTFIESVFTTPNVQAGELELEVRLNEISAGDHMDASVLIGRRLVVVRRVNGTTHIKIDNPHLWTPDDPFLYNLRIRLWKSGKVIDKVNSYFGMRQIEVMADEGGILRTFLNGRYIYNLGVLDQGFWPDGLYTAPTDAALKFDILAAKAMGFNTIRKHIKVEPERWYYYCDKLGMLVWQDMIPPSKRTAEAQAEFEREVKVTLEQLHNHPSITTWVLFNEGWESYDQERLSTLVKALDPSRLLNAQSGPNVTHVAEWSRELEGTKLLAAIMGDESEGIRIASDDHLSDWIGGDMVDVHSYPDPMLPPGGDTRVRVIGEFGGIRLPIHDHVWNGVPAHGPQVTNDPRKFAARYRQMGERLKAFEAKGLSGSIYTQLVDIESEQNGLITYDRANIKVPAKEISDVNGAIVARSTANERAMRAFTIQSVDSAPLSRHYSLLQERFGQGHRDPSLLKQLAFLALALGDQTQATAAGNQYVERASRPYSIDVWRFIQAVTRSTQDEGFHLLQSETERVDELLGRNVAEVVVREVIAREEITPYTVAGSTKNWHELEQRLTQKYGSLGTEEVYGAEMMYYIAKGNWPSFARSFESYFATAFERSEYSIGLLAYVMFKHVNNSHALESAITVCRPQVDILFVCGQLDPSGVDTYANLLYKVGRNSEALEWEERAVQLANGGNAVIKENFSKMKAGQPTWLVSP